MLDRRYIHDTDALRVVEKAIATLCARHLLSGLTLQGQAILIQEAADIPTACTDCRHIWYSPDWMKSGDLDRAVFTLLHEWVHVVGNHPARGVGKNSEVYNIAADYVVNFECKLLGFPIPAGCLVPPGWVVGMSVEQVYARLMAEPEVDLKKRLEEAKGDPLDGDVGDVPQSSIGRDDDQGFEKPGKSAGDLGSRFQEVFSEELQRAVVTTEACQKVVTGPYIKRRLESILDLRPPWDRLILGSVMDGLGSDDYSYCPMNFRLWPETVLPRYFSTKSSSLLIAIDISGSVNDEILRKLVSIAAPAVNRASRVEVCTFDSKMRESKVITSPAQILSLSYKSGPHSHTSAMEVFEKARKDKYRIVLVSTDMLIEYPDKPRSGVIWATPEGSPAAKWGKQFYIKEFW